MDGGIKTIPVEFFYSFLLLLALGQLTISFQFEIQLHGIDMTRFPKRTPQNASFFHIIKWYVLQSNKMDLLMRMGQAESFDSALTDSLLTFE